MKIIYLDQNKWIELARSAKFPHEYPKNRILLDKMLEYFEQGKAIFPLTFTNIYETHKINDIKRRKNLAFVQAALSGGMVFHARQTRVEEEVSQVLAREFDLKLPESAEYWYISDIFLESVLGADSEQIQEGIYKKIFTLIRSRPATALFNFLVDTSNDLRIEGVRRFSAGSVRLLAQVEERRAKHASETLEMRRRIYSAILMINDLDRIIDVANRIGLPWRGAQDMEASVARKIIDDTPTYYIEREIAIRLEAQDRVMEENDFRDMQSFCAAIPYANCIIGEKQFVNLARQARLDKKYGSRLEADILILDRIFDEI